MLEPCVTFDDGFGGKTYGVFHLLTCGHLIAVHDYDLRCGRNCQHAATLIASISARPDAEERKALYEVLNSTVKLDSLHCETCYGILFESYKLIISKQEPMPLRCSVAFTRLMLSTTFGLGDEQVNAMVCPPLFNPIHHRFNWENTHYLRCGHKVWSRLARPCAVNCTDTPGCRGAICPWIERQHDVILCQECIARAELVYRRWEKVKFEKVDSKGSGDVVDGPRFTSESDNIMRGSLSGDDF